MDILLTDDDPQALSGFRRVFERKGHRVDTAATGADTLRALEARSYALVVLDWGLPDLDGVSVVRRLRAAGRTVPVLMLTGRVGDEDVVRALGAGADDFIAKIDARPDVLLARSEALFRRAQYAPAPLRIEVGGVVVDEARQELWVEGAPVEASRAELAVLAILAKNADRLVTRAQLWLAGWGVHSEPNDSALDSLMKRLRKKVAPGGVAIQSVRSGGHLLSVVPRPEPDLGGGP
jgi:DNA-binding response OmpR family regulator